MATSAHQGLILLALFTIYSCGTPLPYSGKTASEKTSFAAAGFRLEGTITTPKKNPASGKMPGILLIAGTPGDRDWNASPLVINSGLILARALAVRGFITHRYDPPGRGKSTGKGKLTRDAAVNALLEAHRILKRIKKCSPGQITWIAHGDAALTALTASTKQRPHRLILLCPPGMAMDQALISQIQDALKRRGLNKNAVKNNLRYLKKGLRALYKDSPPADAEDGIEPALVHALRRLHAPGVREYSHWQLHNSPADKNLPAPDLILMGEQDVQYPPVRHKKPWIKAGVPTSRIHIIPDMDHMLKVQKDILVSLLPGEILRSYTETSRPLSGVLLQKLTRVLQGHTP